MEQVENISRPGKYNYDLKPFTDKQKEKLEENNISSLMITGKILSIKPKKLRQYENNQESFMIVDTDKNYVLLFKFVDNDIKLIDLFCEDNLYFS